MYPDYSPYNYNPYNQPQLINQRYQSNLPMQTPGQLGFNPYVPAYGQGVFNPQRRGIGVGQQNQLPPVDFNIPNEQLQEPPLNISASQAAYTEGATGQQPGALRNDPEYNISGQPQNTNPFNYMYPGMGGLSWYNMFGNMPAYEADLYAGTGMRGLSTLYDAATGNAAAADMNKGQRNTMGVLGGLGAGFGFAASGLNALKGGLTRMGEDNVRRETQASSANNMARILAGNTLGQEALFGNRYNQYRGYYKDGGDIEAALSGRQTTGAAPSVAERTTFPELEEGEFIISGGTVTKVTGDKHEGGGEKIPLEEGSKIISNEGLITKEAQKLFNIKPKQAKKMTFADLFERKSRELGMEKAQKEQEKEFKRLEKNDKKFQDAYLTEDLNTQRFNEEALSKNISEKQEKIDEIQPSQTHLAETIYALQEKAKKSGTYKRKDGTKPEDDDMDDKSKDGGMKDNYYQDGGQQDLPMQIAEALSQGASPEEVLQQLVANGMEQQQATQLVEQVMAQLQQAPQGIENPPASGEPDIQMKDGGMTKDEWVSWKIGKLREEGKSQKQSIAIALSMSEKKYKDGGKYYVDGGTIRFGVPVEGLDYSITIDNDSDFQKANALVAEINRLKQTDLNTGTNRKLYNDALQEFQSVVTKYNPEVNVQKALAGETEFPGGEMGKDTPIERQVVGERHQTALYEAIPSTETPATGDTTAPAKEEAKKEFSNYQVAGRNMFGGLGGFSGDIGYLYPVDRLRLSPFGVPQYGEVSPIRTSPEYAVSEIGRAGRAGMAAQAGMIGAEQSANISNILGKQFEGINQATTQANIQNAQQAQRAQEYNVGQRTRASEAGIQARQQKEAQDFARIAQDYAARQRLADEMYIRTTGLQREQRSLNMAQSLAPNYGLSPYGTIGVNPYAEQNLSLFPNQLSYSSWYNTPEGQEARRKQLQYENKNA